MRVLDEGLEAAALAVRATAGAIFVGQTADSLCCVAAFGPDAKLLLERGGPPNRDVMKNAPLEPGERIKVVRVDGVRLVVQKED